MAIQPTITLGTTEVATSSIYYAVPAGLDTLIGPSTVWTADGPIGSTLSVQDIAQAIIAADPAVELAALYMFDGRVCAWIVGYNLASALTVVNAEQFAAKVPPPAGGDLLLTGDLAYTAAAIFAAPTAAGGVLPSDVTPSGQSVAMGGSAGVSDRYSRGDHSHPLNNGTIYAGGGTSAVLVTGVETSLGQISPGLGYGTSFRESSLLTAVVRVRFNQTTAPATENAATLRWRVDGGLVGTMQIDCSVDSATELESKRNYTFPVVALFTPGAPWVTVELTGEQIAGAPGAVEVMDVTLLAFEQ